jgi:hypothetical protein
MSNDLEAKIVILGAQGKVYKDNPIPQEVSTNSRLFSPGVGKTSLVHRYVKNAFLPPSASSTIGASFLTKRVVDIDTSTVVRLQIWDTAGQEKFRSIVKLYWRGIYIPHPSSP